MSSCRLIIDPPASGAWNMAVDEVLWESCEQAGECCWRFYQWAEPTVSLGYFQNYSDRSQHVASRECPIVRRASGGGAIIHDLELTYSVAIPIAHELAAHPQPLYGAIHTTLIDALSRWAITATLRDGDKAPRTERQPFLCFQRRSSGDVLVGQTKVAGSAQRRNRGAVLQHGSVLLAQSSAAPELQGLQELTGTGLASGDLAREWSRILSERLGWHWFNRALSQDERDRAARLAASKYGAVDWTSRRP